MRDLIFFGEYSIIWQTLALVRQCPEKASRVELYIPKHFTRSVCKDIADHLQWGQKPHGTPMVLQSILSEIFPDHDDNEYLTISKIVKATEKAISVLKDDYNVALLEVKSIDKVERNGKQISIKYTENNSNRTGVKYYDDNIFIFNTLSKPRTHLNSALTSLKDSRILYSDSLDFYDCPKLVIGLGPSAIWVKEVFNKQVVKFVCGHEYKNVLKRLGDNPRNKSTVEKIDKDQDFFPMDRSAAFLTNAKMILELDDSSERNKKFKNEVNNFISKYYLVDLPQDEIVLVLSSDRNTIEFIGQGINTIGYEPNNDMFVLSSFAAEYKEKHIFNLHTDAAIEAQNVVAPADVNGSVLHSLDWQQVLKLSQVLELDNDCKAKFMPIERLFFRENKHKEILHQYFLKDNVAVKDEFYTTLVDKIKKQKESLPAHERVVDFMVDVFKETHSDVDCTKFQSKVKRLIDTKHEVFFQKKLGQQVSAASRTAAQTFQFNQRFGARVAQQAAASSSSSLAPLQKGDGMSHKQSGQKRKKG